MMAVLIACCALSRAAPRGALPARRLVTRLHAPVRCSSSDSADVPPSPPARSATRSTLSMEEETFHAGADQRAAGLLTALSERGFGVEELDALLHAKQFRGSAALRTYNSFVFPKSEGAYWNAEKPGRLATIAQSIVFLVKEQRAEQAEWLRNHDRSRAEADALGPRHPLHLVLDNVRSAHNTGNLLRAAEAARVTCVHSCGITPASPHPALLKTAMGAAEYVPQTHESSTLKVVRALKAEGVAVWACETTERSVDLRRAELPKPLALVLGNELIGVDTDVLEECDGVLQIPMFGLKNSLNVATAGTIVMWEALRQWDAESES